MSRSLLSALGCLLIGLAAGGGYADPGVAPSADASACLRRAAAMEDATAGALERMLAPAGLEAREGRWLRLACRIGRPSDSPQQRPERDGRPAHLRWVLERRGFDLWMEALGADARTDPQALARRFEEGELALFRESPWWPGADPDGESFGDIVTVRTEWSDSEAAREFAALSERAIRAADSSLQRVRQWRLRVTGETVEIELLARKPVEVEPIGEDPWSDVEFGKEGP